MTLRAVLGHNFPAGSYLPKTDHLKVMVANASGKKTEITPTASGFNQMVTFTPQEEGQHVFTADYSSYLASTKDGPIYLPKNKLQGKTYTYCNYVSQCAKAVIGSGDVILKPVGLPIEIVPQVDPTMVKTGDLLPIKILWKGKALGSSREDEVEIRAVYEGFQKDEDTFAFMGHAGKEGTCRVQIMHPGWWVVMVEQRVPAADKTKADEEIYIGTLVFHVAS